MKKLIYILPLLILSSCTVYPNDGEITKIVEHEDNVCVATVRFNTDEKMSGADTFFKEDFILPCLEYRVGDKVQLIKKK